MHVHVQVCSYVVLSFWICVRMCMCAEAIYEQTMLSLYLN